jgi:soluble lytic murein transglycosylase-like protein
MQDAPSQADRVRAAMEPSLALQRASVTRQAHTAGVGILPYTAPTLAMPPPDCDPIPQPQLSRMIDEASAKNGISADLVKEVARQESGFKPCVISNQGAAGLMQLMPATQVQFAVSDPLDARESLDAGAKLLKQLLDRYGGDVAKALGAYNAGAARVDQADGVPDIAETKNYVFSILGRFLH